MQLDRLIDRRENAAQTECKQTRTCVCVCVVHVERQTLLSTNTSFARRTTKKTSKRLRVAVYTVIHYGLCAVRITISLLRTAASTKAGQNCTGIRVRKQPGGGRTGVCGVWRGVSACAAVVHARTTCVYTRPYPFVHLRIGRRFMGISSALWAAGGRAVCAPVHETRPQPRPSPRSGGGDCGGLTEGDSE